MFESLLKGLLLEVSLLQSWLLEDSFPLREWDKPQPPELTLSKNNNLSQEVFTLGHAKTVTNACLKMVRRPYGSEAQGRDLGYRQIWKLFLQVITEALRAGEKGLKHVNV